MGDLYSGINAVSIILYEIETILRMISLVFIAMGVIECLYGYSIYRVMNAIKGFVYGGVAGAVLGAVAMYDQISAGIIIGGLLGGILGTVLANILISFMVFCESFILGCLLGVVLGLAAGSIEAVPLLSMVMGLLLAIVSCIMYKNMIIFITSLHGAAICGIGVYFITGEGALAAVAIILLLAVGIYIQRKRLNSKKDKSNEDTVSYEQNPVLESNKEEQISNETGFEPGSRKNHISDREILYDLRNGILVKK